MSMTINQTIRTRLSKKPRKISRSKLIFSGAPQKKAVCVSVFTRKPKKPNSADRKVAKVKLSTGKMISVYIPGEKHNLQEHSYILVRSGKTQDLPGVSFKAIRGVYDFAGVQGRKSSRSKYGTKRSEK